MRYTTHLPVPEHLTALVEQVHAAGYFTPGHPIPIQQFQRIAGLSRATGAIQHSPGSRPLTEDDPLVARDGFTIVVLKAVGTYAPTALSLAGISELRPGQGMPSDVFAALTDAVAGLAPVPAGTGDLTRTEIKRAFFCLCYSGTGQRYSASVEELRVLAGVTALTWVLPELAAAADRDGFYARTHRTTNDLLWRLLADAHARLSGLAHAVGLGTNEVYLEVRPDDVASVRDLAVSRTLQHVTLEVTPL